MTDSPAFDVDFVRAQFPALSTPWALLDNAGGSVLPVQVRRRIDEYLGRYMMQTGGGYALSQEVAATIVRAHSAGERLIGAAADEVAILPSTTAAASVLARALRPLWRPGDVVVISELDHEANIGPWTALAATGIEIRQWRMRPETGELALEDLEAILDPRVRLVAMTHCANVIGRIHDVAAVAERVHAAGAQLCVDGVAYAPHRLVDVAALGVDYYMLSLYKVYGPHQALLWGRRELLLAAKGQNHSFIPESELPYKLEPGNVNHELAAGIPGILDYLRSVDARHHEGPQADDRSALARCFSRIAAHESALIEPLLAFLADHPKVRLIGPRSSDPSLRVPTVAFTVEGRPSREIPEALEEHHLAIRWGHFYAPRAIRALGLNEADGIIRVSAVHYNTAEEISRLIAALEQVL